MKVALVPAGNKAAREHYADTVVDPIRIDQIREHLSDEEAEAFMRVAPSGRSMVWGVTGDKNLSKWRRIGPGTVCIFARSGALTDAATVTLTFQNEAAAEAIWGRDPKGRAWECMFFLEERNPINAPWDHLRDALGYKKGDRLMGFRVLDGERAVTALEFLEIAPSLPSPASEAEVRRNIEREFDGGETDESVTVRRRREQGLLRNRLVNRRTHAECICCGRTLPVGFLVAAHIKPRRSCTKEERLDFDNVAALMCRLGCDAMFEAGLIFADESGWRYREGVDPKLRDGVKTSNSVSFLTEANRAYFRWHRKHHDQSPRA